MSGAIDNGAKEVDNLASYFEKLRAITYSEAYEAPHSLTTFNLTEVMKACAAQGGQASSLHITVHSDGKCCDDINLSAIKCGDEVASLSTRQSQILEILVAAKHDVVSREEILNRVWGDDSYANSLALNVQISYLRRILSIDPSIEILSIKKRGYTLKIKN